MIMLQPGATIVCPTTSPLPPGMMVTSRQAPFFAASASFCEATPTRDTMPSGGGHARGSRKRVERDDSDYEDDGEPREAVKITKVVVTEKRRKKEKPPVDPEGYRFRKYGKKMIGDEARHYYRCTYPGCDAKRHITYQSEGPSIVLIGSHAHPPPAPPGAAARERKLLQEQKKYQKRAKTAGNRPRSPGCYDCAASVVPSLIQFEDTCEPGEEVVFRLEPHANFTQDGQFWLKAENNDTNVTSFTCTSHECTATKHVEIYDTETLVRYRGPHCHMRPVISTRNNGDRPSVPGPARPAVFKNTSSESASGSRGSLEDVCNVLAIEGEI